MAATPDLTRGPVLLGISTSTEVFALATCIVRLCVRRRVSNFLGLDDYAIGVAAIVGFVGTVFAIIEGSSMVDSPHALEFDWLGQPWLMMATTFAKISICLFFIRLVGAIKQWRVLLSSQILLMAVLNFAFSLTTNLQCRPLEKLWDPAVLGECWDPNVQLNIGYFQGAFSVFWWLFLSLFPVMIVRDLEVHKKMRWPFYVVSSLSLLAGVFATVRTYETSQTVPGVYTFDTFFAALLSILEQNVGIVAANILPMGALFSAGQRDTLLAQSRMSRESNARSFRAGSIRNPFASEATSSAHGSRRSGTDEGGHGSELSGSRLGPPGSSQSSVKRLSMLIIEGPRENTTERSHSRSGKNKGNENNNSNNYNAAMRTMVMMATTRSTDRDSTDGRSLNDSVGSTESFWPRGIIKTVEVEVVEEDIADVMPPPRARQASGASGGLYSLRQSSGSKSDNDWAVLLRSGSPAGSRVPSRQQ